MATFSGGDFAVFSDGVFSAGVLSAAVFAAGVFPAGVFAAGVFPADLGAGAADFAGAVGVALSVAPFGAGFWPAGFWLTGFWLAGLFSAPDVEARAVAAFDEARPVGGD